MNTDSQPATQPVVTEYMYGALGALEPTHAMPEPPKLLPLRRSATRSAPAELRIDSMLPKVPALKLPDRGDIALSAVRSDVASL